MRENNDVVRFDANKYIREIKGHPLFEKMITSFVYDEKSKKG